MNTPTGGPLCNQCSMYQHAGATKCGLCGTHEYLVVPFMSNQTQNNSNKRRRTNANPQAQYHRSPSPYVYGPPAGAPPQATGPQYSMHGNVPAGNYHPPPANPLPPTPPSNQDGTMKALKQLKKEVAQLRKKSSGRSDFNPFSTQQSPAPPYSHQNSPGPASFGTSGAYIKPDPHQQASNQNPFAPVVPHTPVTGQGNPYQTVPSATHLNPQNAPQQPPVAPTQFKPPNSKARKTAEWRNLKAQREVSVVKHNGTFGFTTMEPENLDWCYGHNHTVEQLPCSMSGLWNASLRAPFIMTWTMIENEEPLRRNYDPKKIYECLNELKRVSDILIQYTYFVPLRDTVQKNVIEGFRRVHGQHDPVLTARREQLMALFKANNITTSKFMQNLSRLSKHACSLFLEDLLPHLHHRGWAQHLLNTSSTNMLEITAYYSLLTKWNMEREVKPPHPDLSVKLTSPSLWLEFSELVAAQAQKFVDEINENTEQYPELQEFVSSVEVLRESTNSLLYGGFGPYEIANRHHALPRLIYTDWEPLMKARTMAFPTYELPQNSKQPVGITPVPSAEAVSQSPSGQSAPSGTPLPPQAGQS